jgi:methylmalonyl-CoA/ethylmalonyl-CoA epimerase
VVGVPRAKVQQNHESGVLIKKISHVGVIVSNLDEALKVYEKIFGLKPQVVKEALEGKIRVAFIPVCDGEIELIQPIDTNLPLSKFLQNHGAGIHHIALATDDIDLEIDRMKKQGVAFAKDEPQIGAHGVKIIFTKPETTGDLTVELCQQQ